MGGKKKNLRRTTMVKVSATVIFQNEKYQGNMTGLLFERILENRSVFINGSYVMNFSRHIMYEKAF